jgi:Recombinase zinc beta ribbon domain/Recombinase
VNQEEAGRVRAIFTLYLEHRGLIPVVQELERRGWRNKRWQTRKGPIRGGSIFTKTTLYRLLTNVVYLGKVRYKNEVHTGEHTAIVERAVWQEVQDLLHRRRRSLVRQRSSALLKGLLHCRGCGHAMTATSARKNGGKAYRYYLCQNAIKRGRKACQSQALPASAIERWVLDHLQKFALERKIFPGFATFESLPPEQQSRLIHTWVERIDCEGSQATIVLHRQCAEMPAGSAIPDQSMPTTMVGQLDFLERGRAKNLCTIAAQDGSVPRVARLMALALRFEQLIGEGHIGDYRALAELGQVSRSRISQIMNLTLLAPDIQEAILLGPRTLRGRDSIRLAQLQPIALTWDWEKQRRRWAALCPSWKDSSAQLP